MPKKKNKLRRNIIIIVVILVLVIGYLWINKNTKAALSQYAKDAILGTAATLDHIEVKLTGNGVIEANKRYEVYSNYIGEVKKQYKNINETVSKDDNLLRIGDNYLKAPMAGTVISTNYAEGDYMQSTEISKNPAVVIADMSKVKFTLEVDELEINKVKLGMEVNVTSDAVEDKEYIGIVTKIAEEGKNVNGITTYDVTIQISQYEGLKLGMNVDATLTVESKENTLVIPMQAINKSGSQAYVYIKDKEYIGKSPVFYTAPSSMSEVEGYRKQEVTIGINNKDYIEIVSGLLEGEEVYYISNSKSLTEYMMSRAGSGGGMSIGM